MVDPSIVVTRGDESGKARKYNGRSLRLGQERAGWTAEQNVEAECFSRTRVRGGLEVLEERCAGNEVTFKIGNVQMSREEEGRGGVVERRFGPGGESPSRERQWVASVSERG